MTRTGSPTSLPKDLAKVLAAFTLVFHTTFDLSYSFAYPLASSHTFCLITVPSVPPWQGDGAPLLHR
ncbi:hypothetical protein N7468_007296 [Penicillium chermesinum]|uniref:Uncharacterized protein n=1 Tax=Penicillium chermesinum TaxID=63820 RepID=A0A9W9TKF4_9EURO|nr:uncharacterized protein N7468_007296 [Penicillium chermesinum]KAJ5226071.1 hypothetical protein N7468_007296 [Penicillium chermesinum]